MRPLFWNSSLEAEFPPVSHEKNLKNNNNSKEGCWGRSKRGRGKRRNSCAIAMQQLNHAQVLGKSCASKPWILFCIGRFGFFFGGGEREEESEAKGGGLLMYVAQQHDALVCDTIMKPKTRLFWNWPPRFCSRSASGPAGWEVSEVQAQPFSWKCQD